MKTTVTSTLGAAARLLANKAIAIALLVIGLYSYTHLPAEAAWAELIYACCLLNATSVCAPLMRLLVFPEAASYAESRSLKEDLTQPIRDSYGKPSVSPALIHYWFATAVCYGASIVTISSILSVR